MIGARLKLTSVFAATVTLVAALIATSVASSRTAGLYGAVGRQALATADFSLQLIRQEQRAREATHASSDTAGISKSLKNVLDSLPGYLLVVSRSGTILAMSNEVRDLADEEWANVQRGIADLPDDGPAGIITLGDDKLLLVARAVRDSASQVSRVIAGTRVPRATSWPRELIATVAVVTPLLIALASWGFWLLVGTTFRRLERVRREVADITDGRSLHRRLPAEGASPEIAELVDTLNSMIARLEGSFAALRRFTADASHELKTPLAVLRADVERAMHGNTPRTEKLVALEEALHETTRMADLVDSLLTLARADEGRFDIHRERVDFGALVQDVYETAHILGEGAGVQVNLAFTAEVEVMGDAMRLRQLLLNLVTNAIKYTPRGGRVDIGLGRHPDTITFAVRDTGIGIAAADIPHVFERFWRADRARSRTAERGGFGLGLAISQWIAQAHGGALTVQSRLGKGTLFTLTLPLESLVPELTEA